MMIFVNAVYKEDNLPREYAEGFVKVLSPVAPFVCEELWEMLGHNGTIATESWPTFDEAKTIDDEIEIPVQVNGKLRGKILVHKDASKSGILLYTAHYLTFLKYKNPFADLRFAISMSIPNGLPGGSLWVKR